MEQAFLRFTTGTINGSITSAKLRLYVLNGSPAASGSIRRVSNTSWSERSVTYNTRPALDGTTVGTFGNVAIGQWVEVDVSGVVSAAGTYSFGVSQSGTDGVDFAAREHSTKAYLPQLLVTTSIPTATPTPTVPPPSPTSVAITPTPSPTSAPSTGTLPWLKTVGNKILTVNDNEVTLRGANVLQSEWDLDMTWESKAIPYLAQNWKGNVVLRGFASDPINDPN
ncbi:MAG: hypothetical protein CYG59_11385, partial [Chloroflexi bacterium]